MTRFVFPAVVEVAEQGGYGLFFPDLPGCVTAADSLEALADSAREALQLHIEGMAEDGETIPSPTPMDRLPHDPDVREVGVLLVEANSDGGPSQVSLSLPSALLSRVDEAARTRGVTREAILAEGAEAFLKAG